MDPALIEDERLPLSRKSLLPGGGFFHSDEQRDRDREEAAADALSGRERAAIVDTDADGLSCAALLREAFGDVALVPSSPHDLTRTLEHVVTHSSPGTDVFVCDLVPDRYEDLATPLEEILTTGGAVTWFDHHEWPDHVEEAVRAAGVELTIGDGSRSCTADVVLRGVDHPFPEHLRELAAVTRDHDLWIKEDPRSDDLADFAYWSEPEEFVETVTEHGPQLPPEVISFLSERRVEKEELIARAVSRARFVEVGEWTVGLTYGRCSQNEVAERLRESGADAAVIVKPAGSASIRGSDAFARCHEVAQRVGGGGHPKAAGCKPSIYADMLDYAHHWVTEGAITQRVILDAFEAVAGERSEAP